VLAGVQPHGLASSGPSSFTPPVQWQEKWGLGAGGAAGPLPADVTGCSKPSSPTNISSGLRFAAGLRTSNAFLTYC
jgi:hypothetical protein